MAHALTILFVAGIGTFVGSLIVATTAPDGAAQLGRRVGSPSMLSAFLSAQ